ncbi:hypothetical protein [Streptomyces sp. NPDC020917]|uniref:hypothetical protein n=1 Tax=Streptomyces sp. NPDC020917 TaxID=3365102 RepID=UPI00378ECD2A
MWEQIEAVIPRQELAAAIAALFELTPTLDSDERSACRDQVGDHSGARADLKECAGLPSEEFTRRAVDRLAALDASAADTGGV